jgi:hypothetical protein
MKAFFNDPAVKQKYTSRVEGHIRADNLIQGTAWAAASESAGAGAASAWAAGRRRGSQHSTATQTSFGKSKK